MYDKNMDFKRKIYRMFMLGPEKDFLIPGGNLEYALNSGLGGVIFFTKNISSVEQMCKFTDDIKKTSRQPLFLGIDQEGGRVERTENIFGKKKWLSARYQAQNGIQCVEQQTKEIAEFIKSLGLNMNFAPVLDVDTNPQNPIIAERSYGKTAEEVIRYAVCALKIYSRYGITPVGKHFPGHGDVNTDSHKELPILELTREEVEKIHLKPFKAAIEAKIPAIMIAHLFCPCFDREKIPSSLSKNVIQWVLRGQMGFEGLVVSDDMNMGAVGDYSPVAAVIEGIKAGINLFLFRGSDDETIKVIETVAEIASEQKELIEKVNESVNIIDGVIR